MRSYIALLGGLTSCKAKQAIVQKQPPTPVEIKKYPLASIKNQPIRLTDSTVFLWKKDSEMTAEHVSDVQLLSKEMDQLELAQRELEGPFNDLKQIYETEVAQLDETQKQEWNALPDKIETSRSTKQNYEEKLPQLSANLEIENQKLTTINKNLEELSLELENEKNKTDRNADNIEKLTQKIADLQKDKVSSENKITKISLKIKNLQDNLANTQTELNELETKKSTHYKDVGIAYDIMKKEERQIAPEKQVLGEKGNALIQKLVENVDLLEKPSFLNIKVIDEKINVELAWKLYSDCNDCDETFSSDKNNIQNLSYQEAGGLLEFNLMDQSDVYAFRLVRSKDTDATGRIFYGGDLTITDSHGQKRFGVLKFSSSKY